jgi:H+/Cl- antiporter ClcA
MSIGAFSATSEAALSAVLMSVELVVDFAPTLPTTSIVAAADMGVASFSETGKARAPLGKTNYSRQIIAMQNDADQFAADKTVPAVDG